MKSSQGIRTSKFVVFPYNSKLQPSSMKNPPESKPTEKTFVTERYNWQLY